jgi:mRNA-degrading endonuclease YafQ of YafQ-DinJ toxin-antitoxin module
MKFVYSDSFKANVSVLSFEGKAILKEKLTLMFHNPRHPSLRTKKMQGNKSIFESTITMGTRITWQYIKEDIILLRKVGPHDKTLKNP